MSTSEILHKAKSAKNDEFYTRLSDIEKELSHYQNHFCDKIIYCNCDNPEFSNFWRYFHENFKRFKLKKLISTHYETDKPPYRFDYDGGDDSNLKAGMCIDLKGNGDFRNQECIDILDEADIIITNPPFSLFRDYIDILITHNKKFVIIGNLNAVTYKEIFPLIKDNKIWLGFKYPSIYLSPDDMRTKKELGMCRWFTNLEIDKRYKELIPTLTKKYDPKLYPRFDNYNAINVGTVSDIPIDYFDPMGVPITFIDKYNPNEFEILNAMCGYLLLGYDENTLNFSKQAKRLMCSINNGKAHTYSRIIIRRKSKERKL